MSAFADALEAAWPEIARAPSLREVGVGPAQSVASTTLRTLSAPATLQPVLTRSPRSRRFLPTALVALGLVTLGGAFALRSKSMPVHDASLGTKAIVACPILTTTDPDLGAQTTWLGAAAATLVCARVQAALGGDPARTHVPAELLKLPHEPREGFPQEPFESADAVAKTIAEAKRDDARIEGTLEHAGDFHVALTLHGKGDDVLERGDAHGATLLEALRGAMTPILAKLEPAVDAAYAKRWFAGATSAGRVTAFDLHTLVLAEDTPASSRSARRSRLRISALWRRLRARSARRTRSRRPRRSRRSTPRRLAPR